MGFPADHAYLHSMHNHLQERGHAQIRGLLDKVTCLQLIDLYKNESCFRSVINMQRYRFGLGEYKYFAYPLPGVIASLRETLYEQLVSLANTWMTQLKLPALYPDHHQAFVAMCHAQGQTRPTPLILKYEKGGFNTLHQDIYGTLYFPFQVVIALSQQQADYGGGELVVIEQIPRAQSKAQVIVPNQGDAIILTTNFRPVKGKHGYYRAVMKHGVGEVTSGLRYTLGIIFHDAA